ncbi:MAG TPA: polyprenyl synthetase family protein [Thermomicrobiaceae bacterium]|nr:polyprenyl synthetase family protein [Thermomicrobiaceae bacterium]
MADLIPDIDATMRRVVSRIETATAGLFGARDLPIYGVLRYHLGWAEQNFRPGVTDPGKRIRPLVCVLSCIACGGDGARAIPAAAAIELLHNFTLIHDDVQDRSVTRRHRATVWALWGDGQAINAGDALFAAAQLALLDTTGAGIDPALIVALSRDFNETVLRIVEGQVLDLGFEGRWDIGSDDYLRMIGGKTASLMAFSCRTGATLAGVMPELAARLGDFGRALGLGFQVRDDLLGIWGRSEVTGKPSADDIRRRKKSLPIVMLAGKAAPSDRDELKSIYARPAMDDDAVSRVLGLLAEYDVRRELEIVVADYHDAARDLLEHATPPGPAREQLEALVERLANRAF